MIDQMSHRSFVYPFSAIVGQEQMKKALLLNAICPSIGGVLICGDKGTAKSTAVRGLAAILPEISVVSDCPFQCDPEGKLCSKCQERKLQGNELRVSKRQIKVVDLPLGVTEDRVLGGIHLELAIKEARKVLDPGLLGIANRGILYIDEVNLLPDHIVDIILDASSTGVNTVEREGISFSHPAEFILVGTMNAEEGELRPQILDRFGMCVKVETSSNPEERSEILRRREEFDKNPGIFIEKYRPQQQFLAALVVNARERLKGIKVSEEMIQFCSELSLDSFVAGHRADIVMIRAAMAIAAFKGNERVEKEDVIEAAELVLLHRKRIPSPPPPTPQAEPAEDHEQEIERQEDTEHQESGSFQSSSPPSKSSPEDRQESSREPRDHKDKLFPGGKANETLFPIGTPFRIKAFSVKRDRIPRKGSGRRTRSRTILKTGRYIKSRPKKKPYDLALDATLRAAAPYQRRRRRKDLAICIEEPDFREKVREKRIGNLIVFIVDASGSMGAGKRMVETKAAILSLLMDAYQKRDRVSLVAFRGEDADLLLPPTNSTELACKLLEELPTGGKTPLSMGIALGFQILENQLRKDPDIKPVMVLISDGKANVSAYGGKPLEEVKQVAETIRENPRIHNIVIDTEKGGLVNFGLAKKISAYMDAQYFKIEDLKASSIVEVVNRFRESVIDSHLQKTLAQ